MKATHNIFLDDESLPLSSFQKLLQEIGISSKDGPLYIKNMQRSFFSLKLFWLIVRLTDEIM